MQKPQNGNGKTWKLLDAVLRVLAASSVAVCGFIFNYVVKIETRMTRYDEFVITRYKWNEEHNAIHDRICASMASIDRDLHALITDVRVIQGNRFTSKDGDAIAHDIARMWEEITAIGRDVKRLEQLVMSRN